MSRHFNNSWSKKIALLQVIGLFREGMRGASRFARGVQRFERDERLKFRPVGGK
jgi:hypothetical protein